MFHHENVTAEVSGEIENDLTPEDKIASQRAKWRRPSLNFLEMGLSIGDKIYLKSDSSIVATVISETKVEYQGDQYSLSPLTAKILNAPNNVAPCPWWLYEEKSLSDIYDETYPFED